MFLIDDWNDIAAIAAILGLPFGLWQLRMGFLQQKKWQTLNACFKYEESESLRRDIDAISEKKKGPNDYSNMVEAGFELNMLMLLNYFDALAIGVKQGLYRESIIKAHMKAIIPHYVEEVLEKLPADADRIQRKYYTSLLDLYKKWSDENSKVDREG